jgi:4-hydroxythreonine-4-phosphate dehydrogenase
MNHQTLRLAFTIGDANGIGIEVMVKAMARPELRDRCEPMIVGNRRLLREYLQALPLSGADVTGDMLVVDRREIPIVEVPSDASLSLGHVDAGAGKLAGDAIRRGVELTLSGQADALVTMPISKSALHAGGYDFPGHTEMIAWLTGGTPMMVLMTEGLRVALATIHVPLRAVPDMIDAALIEARVHQVDAMLRNDFAAATPKIAVLGLNPHAGEDGEIGREEIEIITPALERLRASGTDAQGPFPADGFFARFEPGRYDAVLAMYHDQGLIPLKFYARGGGVNYTANLPIVRTSPDHGTAFAIAGRGIADESSVIEAARVAMEVVGNRRRNPIG